MSKHYAELHQNARIDWMYPEIYEGDQPSRLTIAMNSVRASNSLMIEYESKRDGWVIRADIVREDPSIPGLMETTEEAVEVAFVSAWLEEKPVDNHDRLLTCVYCGTAYPPGEPTHGSATLTAHIEVCEKHPLRAAKEALAERDCRIEELETSLREARAFGDERHKTLNEVREMLRQEQDKLLKLEERHR